MQRTYTYYDTLGVTKTAPPEVIRGAYLALARKFQPAANAGDAQAVRMMTLLNGAYDVLSDPAKRGEYDERMERHAQMLADVAPPSIPTGTNPRPRQIRPTRPSLGIGTAATKFGKYVIGIAALAAVFWLASVSNRPTVPPPGPKPYSSEPPPTRNDSGKIAPSEKPAGSTASTEIPYQRPSAAPNGRSWPVNAGYLLGVERLMEDGHSTVTVDNSRNDSDVYAKLVTLAGDTAYPVCEFFVPIGNKFTLGKVSPGLYDVRYRQLSTGLHFRTQSFNVTETGTEYSAITMTLYKVRNGNMQTFPLRESDF
jgi:curved DNA-binding protein CbpA